MICTVWHFTERKFGYTFVVCVTAVVCFAEIRSDKIAACFNFFGIAVFLCSFMFGYVHGNAHIRILFESLYIIHGCFAKVIPCKKSGHFQFFVIYVNDTKRFVFFRCIICRADDMTVCCFRFIYNRIVSNLCHCFRWKILLCYIIFFNIYCSSHHHVIEHMINFVCWNDTSVCKFHHNFIKVSVCLILAAGTSCYAFMTACFGTKSRLHYFTAVYAGIVTACGQYHGFAAAVVSKDSIYYFVLIIRIVTYVTERPACFRRIEHSDPVCFTYETFLNSLMYICCPLSSFFNILVVFFVFVVKNYLKHLFVCKNNISHIWKFSVFRMAFLFCFPRPYSIEFILYIFRMFIQMMSTSYVYVFSSFPEIIIFGFLPFQIEYAADGIKVKMWNEYCTRFIFACFVSSVVITGSRIVWTGSVMCESKFLSSDTFITVFCFDCKVYVCVISKVFCCIIRRRENNYKIRSIFWCFYFFNFFDSFFSVHLYHTFHHSDQVDFLFIQYTLLYYII